jgi:hypothetical protein
MSPYSDDDHLCSLCRDARVKEPGDLCPRCVWEKNHGYRIRSLGGRAANGMELDHGSLNHAIPLAGYTALCGRKPGRRSIGWTYPIKDRENVTCPGCSAKLDKKGNLL